jgi:zinc protease
MSGLKAALAENKRVLEHGFTESELDRAKKSLLNQYESQYNERNKTGSDRLVSSYVDTFLEGEPEPGIEWEYDMVQKLLPTIGIKDINELPKKWITKENRVVIITAPDKEGVKIPTESEISKILDEVDNMEVEAYEDKVIDEPLMAEMPTAGKVTAEKSLTAVGATELILSNGVKVVLKPTDYKDDEILMTAFSFGGHSLVADGDYQSASNASDIVNESGIREFSSTDLQKLLTGKTVDVSPYISEVSEGFNGSASPKDLETMLQLVNLYFTAPRLDKTAFESYVTKQKSFLKNIMKNPQFAFLDKQINVMTQNHPRGGGIPKPEDFDKIDLDRAFKIYQERFADASDFTFVMIGNFETDKIKPWLETYLGSLPSTNRKETFRDLGVRTPEGMVKEKFEQGKDPKSQVMISFNGEFKKNEERYLMRSLAEVLTIKLIENLREEKGGVYGTRASASTSLYPYKSYGLSVNFTCAPENVQELMAAVYEEIEKVQKNGPTEEDLNKIKEAQRKDVEKNEKENRFWLNGLRSVYYEGGDIAKLTSQAQLARIDKLSGKSLKKIAKKYLDMSNHITLVMDPEPTTEETGSSEKVQATEQSAQANEVSKEDMMKDMTAEKVINKYIEAIGGEAKLKTVKGISRSAKVEVMGMEIGMEVAQEMPGKTFLTQNMMGQEVMKMVINGEKAVVTTPQGENTVEGKEALKMSNPGIFPEMYYLDTENFTVKLDGVEMIDGKPAYKLTVNDPMREAEITNWFSAETGLMIKNDNVQATSTITEYETIDGIKFPKVMKVFQKAQNMEMIMTFDDTKLNPTFEADKFKVD